MMLRKFLTRRFTFANGGTVCEEDGVIEHGVPGAVIVPAEFNNDTLTFSGVGPWGVATILTKTVTTGINTFTSEEIGKLFAFDKIRITTDNAVSAAAELWVQCKS